jgi:hypothetical protein
MRIFLLIALSIATLWDAFTTVYGTVLILGDGPVQIVAAILFGVLILGFSLNTTRIFRLKTSFVVVLTRIFWFIAICYDFYTSWVANRELLTSGRGGFAESFILFGVTLMVTISPILLAALWQFKERNDKDD